MAVAKIPVSKWDPADCLETEEDMLNYLNIAMEDPFPELIIAVLGDIARAKGAKNISEASFDDKQVEKAIQNAAQLFPDTTGP